MLFFTQQRCRASVTVQRRQFMVCIVSNPLRPVNPIVALILPPSLLETHSLGRVPVSGEGIDQRLQPLRGWPVALCTLRQGTVSTCLPCSLRYAPSCLFPGASFYFSPRLKLGISFELAGAGFYNRRPRFIYSILRIIKLANAYKLMTVTNPAVRAPSDCCTLFILSRASASTTHPYAPTPELSRRPEAASRHPRLGR